MCEIGLRSTLEHFWGCGHPVDFIHCFWSCPIVSSFLSEVDSFLSTVLGVPNILHPKICLLGIFGELSVSTYIKRLLRIFYFYMKKTILLSWKWNSRPTITTWLQLVNKSLPLYKLTFELQMWPLLFEKLWHRWVCSPLTLAAMSSED